MRPEIPSVTIELDRPRRIVYTHASMRRVKEQFGTLSPNLANGEDILNIGPFIWACLAPEDRDITVEEIDGMIHPAVLPGLMTRIAEMFRASMPEQEGNEEAPTAMAAGES